MSKLSKIDQVAGCLPAREWTRLGTVAITLLLVALAAVVVISNQNQPADPAPMPWYFHVAVAVATSCSLIVGAAGIFASIQAQQESQVERKRAELMLEAQFRRFITEPAVTVRSMDWMARDFGRLAPFPSERHARQAASCFIAGFSYGLYLGQAHAIREGRVIPLLPEDANVPLDLDAVYDGEREQKPTLHVIDGGANG